MKRAALAVMLIAGLSISALMVTSTPVGAQPPPTLNVTKCVVSPATPTQCLSSVYASPGSKVLFQVCVTNTGPGTATAVSISDVVAPFLTPDQGTALSTNLGDLAVGQTGCGFFLEKLGTATFSGTAVSTINGQQIYNSAVAQGTNTNPYTSNTTTVEVSAPVPAPATIPRPVVIITPSGAVYTTTVNVPVPTTSPVFAVDPPAPTPSVGRH